jgi:hypothetical protein
MLRELAQRTSAARTLHSFETGLLETLHAHPKEAPFALLYVVDQRRELFMAPPLTPVNVRREEEQGVRLRYAGSVGVPDSHPSAPEDVAINHGALTSEATTPLGSPPAEWPWPFAEAMRTHAPVLVENISELIKGYPVRAWDELPDAAVVMPLNLDSEEGLPGAILVLGLSCRLDYDATYAKFIQEYVQPILC